jgi:HAE1 family hydrophobic/amphiphilic exporter-1
VVLALMMFRSTLSMFSIIGVVMLMGLVTKNAILLVDFAIRAVETTAWNAPRPCCWPPRCGCAHPHDHAGHDLSAWCRWLLP